MKSRCVAPSVRFGLAIVFSCLWVSGEALSKMRNHFPSSRRRIEDVWVRGTPKGFVRTAHSCHSPLAFRFFTLNSISDRFLPKQ